jgi:DNA repair exonuclease SbcCD ATPase subunit
MKFGRLFLEDCFSYSTLDIQLCDLGLVLVEGENRDLGGSNGSGKSNLFKSLTWVLFGKAPQNGKELSGDDVIREDTDHQPIEGRTRGFLEVHGENAVMQIYRHRKHADFGNKVLVYIDGTERTMGSDKETQLVIEDFIGCDYDAFVHAVMFPQDNQGFAQLTDAKQKAILDKILDTERFERARQRAKVALKPLLESFSKLQGQLSALQRAESTFEQNIQEIERQQLDWHDKLVEQVQAYEQQLEKLIANPPVPPWGLEADNSPSWRPSDIRLRYEQLRQFKVQDYDLEALEARQQQLNTAVISIAANLKLLNQQKGTEPVWKEPLPQDALDPQFVAESDFAVKRIDELRYLINVLQANINSRQSQISQKQSTHNCPTCEQPLSDEIKDRMFGSFETEQAEDIKKLAEAKAELERVVQESNAHATVKASYSRYETYLSNLETWRYNTERINSLEIESRTCAAEMEKVVQAIAIKTEHDNIEARFAAYEQDKASHQNGIEAVKQHIFHLNNQPSPYDDLYTKAISQLADCQRQIRRLRMLSEEMDSQISMLRFWEDGFGPKGVRSLLLDHITPELNRIANEYLDVLSCGMAKMEFSTTKELKSGERRDNFHISVEYQHGGGHYDKISGGERQRPDLAAMFALGDLAAARSR